MLCRVWIELWISIMLCWHQKYFGCSSTLCMYQIVNTAQDLPFYFLSNNRLISTLISNFSKNENCQLARQSFAVLHRHRLTYPYSEKDLVDTQSSNHWLDSKASNFKWTRLFFLRSWLRSRFNYNRFLRDSHFYTFQQFLLQFVSLLFHQQTSVLFHAPCPRPHIDFKFYRSFCSCINK